MNLQISNVMTKEGDKWRYVGIVVYNALPYRATGLVDRKRTQGMLKKAIIEDVKRQIQEKTKSLPVKTKTLTPDVNFVKL